MAASLVTLPQDCLRLVLGFISAGEGYSRWRLRAVSRQLVSYPVLHRYSEVAWRRLAVFPGQLSPCRWGSC